MNVLTAEHHMQCMFHEEHDGESIRIWGRRINGKTGAKHFGSKEIAGVIVSKEDFAALGDVKQGDCFSYHTCKTPVFVKEELPCGTIPIAFWKAEGLSRLEGPIRVTRCSPAHRPHLQ